MLNILYFAPSETLPNETASSTHVLEITSNMQDLGNEVYVYANSPCPFSLAENRIHMNVEIRYVRFPVHFFPSQLLYIPLVWASHTKLCSQLKDVDVLHERFWVPEFFGPFYAKKYKIPFFLEVNSPLVEEQAGYLPFNYIRRLNRLSQFDSVNAIITQTNTLRRLLEKITTKPIFVVPNGVNIDMFHNAILLKNSKKIRDIYGIRENTLLITYVGTFREWHGVELIPSIAKKILEKHSVNFMLVGGGPLLREIRSKVSNSNLRGKIVFTGPVNYEEIPLFEACSDILIAPYDISNCEPLKKLGFWGNPTKIYEYMGSEKPIVSFDFKEVRNVVRDSALLAEPSNLYDFVEKVRVLIEDEGLRKSLGKRAFQIASNEYTWKRRAKQTLETYQRCQ